MSHQAHGPYPPPRGSRGRALRWLGLALLAVAPVALAGCPGPSTTNPAGARGPWGGTTAGSLGGATAPARGPVVSMPDGTSKTIDQEHNTEAYDRIYDNEFKAVAQDPLSTFSIDVDTASYANVRRFLSHGQLPPKDAVRIEEMVNYFPYNYAPPAGDKPFAVHVEVAGCPWHKEHRLVRVGLKGKEIDPRQRPPCNLVFLIDVSGSMQPENRLPLVKRSLKLLVEQLTERDRIALVVYAGTSGLVLPSTPCGDKAPVLAALDRLEAGGSTNGGAGIELAYRVAAQHFIPGGSNRVILATDGDFNVGVTDRGSLVRLVEEKAKTKVFLTVLGFGMGNLKDATMEQLADKGHGNYAYIDTLGEARKVLVEQASGTLVTIAKDVKVQVEFNPAKAAGYRLIGYENRVLAHQDFNDDKKDAGDIGAGHTVTALYEVVPAGQPLDVPAVDPLKYRKPAEVKEGAADGELLTVKLRYKEPDGDQSELLQVPVTDSGASAERASADFRFAAAVAAFGMLLRDSPHKGSAGYAAVRELAGDARNFDPNAHRAEFLKLVEAAESRARAQQTGRANPAPQ
jgi:Ca-activated chloride channel homolog